MTISIQNDESGHKGSIACQTQSSDPKQYSTPEEQRHKLWKEINENNAENIELNSSSPKEWPGYNTVMSDMATADYTQVLECPLDILQKKRGTIKDGSTTKNVENDAIPKFCKTLCPHGVVCCAQLKLFSLPHSSNGFSSSPYTGLLTPGKTIENCILRLSSAIKPPGEQVTSFLGKAFLKAAGGKLDSAKLFPTAAIKAFRGQGIRSGNLLFGGAKVGQTETDFFAHCLSTQMTERVAKPLKPFIKRFYSYSENPMSLGVSDFCSHDEEGQAPKHPFESSSGGEEIGSSNVNFPYVVILFPVYQSGNSSNEKEVRSFDSFLNDLMSIPIGSVLFDIFACPDPQSSLDPSRMERIGQVVTTSEMISSSPDDGIFFRHQKKEEDFDLRPEWRKQVKAKCSPDGGKTVGTIDRLAGWRIFEGLIRQKKYVDYEELAKAKS